MVQKIEPGERRRRRDRRAGETGEGQACDQARHAAKLLREVIAVALVREKQAAEKREGGGFDRSTPINPKLPQLPPKRMVRTKKHRK